MKKSKKLKGKKKEVPVRLERGVRVTFFLPAETNGDIGAVQEVIISLDRQYLADTITKFTVTGFTHSNVPLGTSTEDIFDHELSFRDEIFFGHWWSDVKVEGVQRTLKQLIIEGVVFFLIDFPAFPQEWELDQALQRLKEEIFSIYKKHKRPQKEIWIVKQDIYRYT